MRAGIRVATASALWGCGFLALAHTHLAPEKSIRVERLVTTWESTGRFRVVVDVASVVVAAA